MIYVMMEHIQYEADHILAVSTDKEKILEAFATWQEYGRPGRRSMGTDLAVYAFEEFDEFKTVVVPAGWMRALAQPREVLIKTQNEGE